MTEAQPQPRNAAEQARLEAAMIDLFQNQIAFVQTLELKITSVQPGDVRAVFAMKPLLVGHTGHGRLHGGVISTALDHTAGLAIVVALGARHPCDSANQLMHRFGRLGTIDLRVDYLRQGLGRSFTASAEVTRLGGRIASTQMKLINDEGTLIATGAASYAVS